MRVPHNLPPTPCPSCGAVLDEAAGVAEPRHPRPGDYTLCAYCLAVLAFDAELQLVAVPPAAALPALELLDRVAVQEILAAWAAEESDQDAKK